VTPRTVYRDLDDLQGAGFPIYNELIDGVGHWQFIDGYRASLPTPFSLNELMSLYLSRDLLGALSGTFFYDSLQNLIGKIRAQLGPKLMAYLDATEQAFAAGAGPRSEYRHRKELIHLLNEACLGRQVVKFRYFSRKKEATTRKVNPYKVYYYQGTLYLIGFDQKRDDMRMFVLDRIKLLQKTGESFEAPRDFNLQDYLKHSFGVMTEELVQVGIYLDPAIASFVAEKSWHPSQKLKHNRDGSIEMSFLGAGTLEIKQWILSLGSMARVLYPQELTDEVTRDLEAALANYRGVREPITRKISS